MINRTSASITDRLPCTADAILAELEPFKEDMAGVVVESTFNWYWLVDLLMDNGYKVHLANPAAIQQYKGLKHSVMINTPGGFYNRKASKTNRMVAHSALAHKLTRAAYYIMRDDVEFYHQKLFA